MRRLLCAMVVLSGLAIAPGAAHATFHLWDIQEVYSDASGSIQYIELFTTSSSQQFLNGETITATSDGDIQTFTFPGNAPAGTANKRLLIATVGYNATCTGAPADFILPDNFFNPAAAMVTINFGSGSDIETITTPKIPVDGTSSYNNGGVIALSTPTNFATAFECLNGGACANCVDGTFCDGAETCTTAGCAGTNPCPGMMCDEATDTCFECDDAGDCDDANPCTDETCNGSGVCVRTNNTNACNDNLFCTQTDACAGGACVGTGATCGIQNCSEGGDFCGDCDDPGDCADGVFCNGDEVCTTGACGAAAAGPCDLVTMTCDEGTDTCPLIPAPDAGVPDAATPSLDAETSSPDAAPVDPPGDGGCDCATGGAPTPGSLALIALVALVSRARRARARR